MVPTLSPGEIVIMYGCSLGTRGILLKGTERGTDSVLPLLRLSHAAGPYGANLIFSAQGSYP